MHKSYTPLVDEPSIFSPFLGNGVDKLVYALSEKEADAITYVLKIFRYKISEDHFKEWQASEAKLKEAVLEFNKISDHKIGEYRVEYRFPRSYYFFINGFSIEIQDYIEGPYFDEISNRSKLRGLYDAIGDNDLNRITEEADKLLEIQPQNPIVLQLKGRCLIKLGRIDEGIECLEHAVEADPEMDGLYSILANAKLGKGDFSQAKLYARQAVGSNPSDIDAYSTLFNVEIRTGNVMNAMRTLSCLKEMGFPSDRLPMMEQQMKEANERA